MGREVAHAFAPSRTFHEGQAMYVLEVIRVQEVQQTAEAASVVYVDRTPSLRETCMYRSTQQTSVVVQTSAAVLDCNSGVGSSDHTVYNLFQT